MHLSVTDYGNILANEPSPLATTTIFEKCTEKLVNEFNFLMCNSVQPLTKFLEYITCGLLADPPYSFYPRFLPAQESGLSC